LPPERQELVPLARRGAATTNVGAGSPPHLDEPEHGGERRREASTGAKSQVALEALAEIIREAAEAEKEGALPPPAHQAPDADQQGPGGDEIKHGDQRPAQSLR